MIDAERFQAIAGPLVGLKLAAVQFVKRNDTGDYRLTFDDGRTLVIGFGGWDASFTIETAEQAKRAEDESRARDDFAGFLGRIVGDDPAKPDA